MTKLFGVGLLAGFVLGIVGSTARAVEQDAIDKAIDNGVVALRAMQGRDGTWRHPDIGATALAGLTLLECGAQTDDKAVMRAATAIRRASLNLTHNYSIALAILFFDRLGDPADIPLIESLTVRLLAGQSVTGGWNYNSPAVSDAEVRRLQASLAGRKELVGRHEPPKPGTVRRTAKDLPKAIHQQLAALNRRMAGSVQELGSDNSNTQFATLALWVGRRYGLPVESALKRVEIRFRRTQNADGGWGYFDHGAKGPLGSSTASMTCAGLLGLAVANGKISETARAKNPDRKAGRDINKDANLHKGLLALSTAVGQPQGGQRRRRPGVRQPIGMVGGRTYYFLWSMERVAVALDLKTIGKKDWYGWGAEILLANQQADGTWQGNYGGCGADTCFALLFLKRANLVPDLTTQLAGQLKDAGERTLKGGGVGGGGLMLEKIAQLRPGIESNNTKSAAEPRQPQPISKPLQGQPDKGQPFESAAARMAKDLVKATGSNYTMLLKQLREGKGALFTEALALAIPRLTGENKRKARTALAERLTRMKDSTLTNYLKDEDAEIRRAAALAGAAKASKPLVPHLIPLLRDPQRFVGDAAHEALKDLTAQDFGPDAEASREDRDQAARKWLSWWNKQERK